jgi:ABC-type Zn uptake system ZnuABC Zn-binding protein ZnuA
MEQIANEIAEWMFNEVKSAGILYQSAAVEYIVREYGEMYIYVNENGNQSIAKDVKKAFKKLHGGRAAWERDGFFWGWH